VDGAAGSVGVSLRLAFPRPREAAVGEAVSGRWREWNRLRGERKMGLRWRLICEGRLVWFVLAESKGGGCSVMVLFSKGAAAWRR
jgi:hypothetical protein